MRRARYTGFYRTFDPRPKEVAEPQPLREPLPSIAELHREYCQRWRPFEHFVSITDTKERTWLVYDARDCSSEPWPVPFGATRGLVRWFWREDHVRRVFLSAENRSTDLDSVRRQLRFTSRVDAREDVGRSIGTAIQDLYDSRRGMGRRLRLGVDSANFVTKAIATNRWPPSIRAL
jgi:hypothetical protein